MVALSGGGLLPIRLPVYFELGDIEIVRYCKKFIKYVVFSSSCPSIPIKYLTKKSNIVRIQEKTQPIIKYIKEILDEQ